MRKKKILFAAQNFAVGGVQKALMNLLCKMSATGEYEIHIFTFSGGPLLDELPKSVTVLTGGKLLNLSSQPLGEILSKENPVDIFLRVCITIYARLFGFERFYRKCFRAVRYKEQFDIAVSYFTDVPVGFFNKGTNLFVTEFVNAPMKAAWIHTDPISAGFDKVYCRRVYKPFDKIFCVSNGVREKFLMLLPEYADKTEVRHNVFCESDIRRKSTAYVPFEKNNLFHIVTVARVDNASKRIDGIVKLCKRLVDNGCTRFCWHIVGNGPDMQGDIALAEQSGARQRVIFEGEKDNPYPYVKNADLFALYSAYEGYPLVIGEAMILHTPILTSRYAAASEQIPQNCGQIADSDEQYFKLLYDKIIQFQNGIQPVNAVCIETLT